MVLKNPPEMVFSDVHLRPENGTSRGKRAETRGNNSSI